MRFVGRVKELASLDAWGRGDGRVLVLYGSPGVGKTRIALEWAHHQAAMFPGGRFFISLRADPHGALHGVARLCGVSQHPGERVDEWATRTLQHIGALQALVIFDEVPSPDAFAVWFKRMSVARAIVVTNERVWPAGYERVPVDVLDEEDARALAMGVIGHNAAGERYADTIVERAGRNAVQIVVDAAAVHEAVELGEAPSLPPLPAAEATESFERAWGTAPADARTFVCALALYRAQGTPHARVAAVLAADAWDEPRARKASSEALRRHLLTRDGDALSMQPLLRTFARHKAAGALSLDARQAHARAFVTSAEAFRASPANRAMYAELAYDEFEAASWDALGVPWAPTDRATVGEALREAGRFAEAQGWYERAAEAYRRGDIHGRVDHFMLGSSLHCVGFCLSALERFAEAQLRHAEATKEFGEGDDHGRVDHNSLGASLHQTGICLTSQERIAEAREAYERAANEFRKGDLHGRVNHEALGTSLHHVGLSLSAEQRFAEAREWFDLAVMEEERGDAHGRVNHFSLGMSYHCVGYCLSSQGQFAEAQGWYERAAEAHRRGDIHGRVDHSVLAWAKYRASLCLLELGRVEEARASLETSVREMRLGDVYGRVHTRRLATCLEALADTLEGLGLRDEARALRAEAATG